MNSSVISHNNGNWLQQVCDALQCLQAYFRNSITNAGVYGGG